MTIDAGLRIPPGGIVVTLPRAPNCGDRPERATVNGRATQITFLPPAAVGGLAAGLGGVPQGRHGSRGQGTPGAELSPQAAHGPAMDRGGRVMVREVPATVVIRG
jgi:hypothetical protein